MSEYSNLNSLNHSENSIRMLEFDISLWHLSPHSRIIDNAGCKFNIIGIRCITSFQNTRVSLFTRTVLTEWFSVMHDSLWKNLLWNKALNINRNTIEKHHYGKFWSILKVHGQQQQIISTFKIIPCNFFLSATNKFSTIYHKHC